MHECVGASQGYHGVVGGLGLGLVLGGGVSMAICPTGVGIPLYPWQHLDRTVWAVHHRPHDSPATRQYTHACIVTNRVFRREIQVVG